MRVRVQRMNEGWVKHVYSCCFQNFVDGSEVQTVAGRSPVTANAGSLLYDSPGEVHETQNTAPVKVLVVRIIEKGKHVTTQVP